jgi:uncharacterized protein YbjT (DUF2867 family)
MRVLVTGASGFVGSLLVPRLLAEGHSIVAVGRDAERVGEVLGRDPRADSTAGVEVRSADVLSGRGLDQALAEVEVAYYLIHSMERAPAPISAFVARERLAAETFVEAATRAQVRRVVYLGGLVPTSNPQPPDASSLRHDVTSAHLASRKEVEEILLGAIPDSLALRASIVIGARSRSFRLLVRLVERLPILTLPAWQRFRTQPIDERDVIEMLTACAVAQPTSRSLEIGGPNVLTYGGMLTRIAELMLVSRPTIRLKVNLTPVAARVAAALVNEDPELVLPLMEGLQSDLLLSDTHAAEQLKVRLHTFDSAVEHALGEWERSEPLTAR